MAKNGPIRDQRRLELIQATIAIIAQHGYSGTTVARVARKAGLSTGLMNFHFDSKDRLFRATFDFLAAEYQQVWDRNLAAAQALIDAVVAERGGPVAFVLETFANEGHRREAQAIKTMDQAVKDAAHP